MANNWKKYEKQAINYHRLKTNQTTWHWNDIPEDDLFNSGYMTDNLTMRMARKRAREEGDTNVYSEYGLDGLSYNPEKETYNALQMKYYPSKSSYIKASDLGTFQSVVHNRLRKLNKDSIGYLYYHGRIEKILEYDLTNGGAFCIENLKYNNEDETIIKPTEASISELNENQLVLRDYQIECINALEKADWEQINVIEMACGTGKTLVYSNYASKHYKKVILLQPTRQLVSQQHSRILNFFNQDISNLIVDSDKCGTRNIAEIKSVWTKDQWVISSTYESACDVLTELVKQLYADNTIKDVLLIADEFHNSVSYQKIFDFYEYFKYVLGVTATCIEFRDFDCTYDIVYSFSMRKAIDMKLVCDYNLYLPYIDADDENIIPSELTHLNSDLLLQQCLYLCNGMLKTGSKKCIVFCSTKEECKLFQSLFVEIMTKYHFYPDKKVKAFRINDDVNHTTRNKTIKQFSVFDGICILANCRILNEGIDIVKCDSVFILHLSEHSNKISMIQRMSRSNRLDITNPNKQNNVFLWVDDENSVVSFISELRNIDSMVFDKIKKCSVNYDNTRDKKVIEKVESNLSEFKTNISVKCLRVDEIWMIKLKTVELFLNKNKKKPIQQASDINEKRLGIWICHQITNYKKRKDAMKDDKIYEAWTKHVEAFSEYYEDNYTIWYKNLYKVEEFLNKNKKKPYQKASDINEKRLGQWINAQTHNYKKRKHSMKDDKIYEAWNKHIKILNILLLMGLLPMEHSN